MATMVKEKRREKKKAKEKPAPISNTQQEQPSLLKDLQGLEDEATTSKIVNTVPSKPIETSENSLDILEEVTGTNKDILEQQTQVSFQVEDNKLSFADKTLNTERNTTENEQLTVKETDSIKNTDTITKKPLQVKLAEKELHTESQDNTYQDLNSRLERISIPKLNQDLNLEDIQCRLENPQTYLKLDKEQEEKNSEFVMIQEEIENVIPSAPMFEEAETTQYIQQPQPVTVQRLKPKLQCMSLEEALNLYGGTEMERVKAMSEKEEAIVEAGPVSGPEHPLVDLLSTFRTSLIAVDRERLQLSKRYFDEEKYRKSLWKVTKRSVTASETCACGETVTVYATYEHAELLKEKLPVAKLKLEGLLRDVQDSYCHHQHAAILAHCQIEELISEIMRSNKKEIREALALVLQALRMSDNAPTALSVALQRWAAALSAAMLDGRDISQLLHLLHHLFRQTRSVRWAARVIRSYVRAGDRSEAAQAVAVLHLLLSRTRVDSALECTEDVDESWEEMDQDGSGAVSDGSLRERDLLALLRGFPLREVVARIVLFPHADITGAREYEWGDRSGGSGVLKACCGARALLHALQGGVTSHPAYTRLHATLKGLAVQALHALAGLHLHSRDYYSKDLEEKIAAELEACFCAGFNLLGAQELQELPVTLLSDHTAREYCLVNILALHDKSPKQLDFLPLSLPAVDCGERVRTVGAAALQRSTDTDLARTVLEFLFQTGIKRKQVPCKGSCEATSRRLLPRVLDAHSYLHTVALHTLAEYYQVEALEPSSLDPLSPHCWRPTPGEARQLLDDWAVRCPALLQHLLLKLDYKPHSGLSLESQLAIGSWLCSLVRAEGKRGAPEWAWAVLRRLRVHRAWWGAAPDAPPPDPPPTDLFSMAYAVMSSSWGHCIPVICSEGVSALCAVAASRACAAAHCLAPVMLLMAHSPESVAYTPKFTELFSLLLKAGPTMMQRALGWGPEPASELLLRLILEQLEGNHPGISRSSLVSAWLHALWKPSLPSSAQLDTILLATRDWAAFDAHANILLQDKNASEHLSSAVRNVSIAPMVCACVLRVWHAAHEAGSGRSARLLDVLHLQRVAGDRIHVDNALKHIGANLSSEDLAIHRCTAALLSADVRRPALLTLWALFYHLYLQRPPCSMTDTTPPVGPLFFSGLIKSRVLAQLRKKLLETISYHHIETENLKKNSREETPRPPARSKTVKQHSTEDGVVPMLDIRDLTGESSESSESESENSENEREAERRDDVVEKKEVLALLVKFHAAAESMCKEYLRWLDEADKTRAMPHHADVARFIPEQVLGAAWSRELSSRRPPPLPLEPPSPTAPAAPRATPFQSTVARILTIKDCSRKRPRRMSLKSPLEDTDPRDARSLLSLMDKHLSDLATLAEEWCNEVARVSSLDSALWELVTSLRIRRRLPPVRKQCAQRCKPTTVHIPHDEWCISTGAERGIEENRHSALAVVRRLARPRPHAARSAAALITIARRVRSAEAGTRAAERAWLCARRVHTCAPAHAALTATLQLLADTWLSNNGKICSDLISRWGNNCTSTLQQSLCGALVSPRRLPAAQWPPVYSAVLRARLPPHIAFSYLSKFEMCRWAEVAASSDRRELLEALVAAAQRWGPNPDEECHVLLELLGVHTATILSPAEICAHIVRCARASVACALPPAHWTHVARAAALHSGDVPFDQLGHLLRELGVVWWEARSGLKGPKLAQYAQYAPHTAELLHAVTRAFTAAAVSLSYAPERVALYVWSAIVESWGPWVSPHAGASPLLSPDPYTDMLKKLVHTIQQVMLDCPGIEEHLLARVFEWVVQSYLSTHSAQECRVQLSTLLGEMSLLPWGEHQWQPPLQPALQVCDSNIKELQSWCSDVWRSLTAESWLRGAADEQLACVLACLLRLYTCMPIHQQTLEQATRLPWRRLPEAALDDALDTFFRTYHSPASAYHDVPCFRVILFASELLINPTCPPPVITSAVARSKRGLAVSRWTCSACAPALQHHVTAHAQYVLRTLTNIAPYLEGSVGEIEELLGRAVAVMCIEPAATAALPVWCEWVSVTSARLVCACVSVASVVTAFEYFAPLADASVRAHCNNTECGGWSDITSRLSSCPWREAGALVARGRLHAAYALALTHAQTDAMMHTAFLALLAANINYIENEAIVSVWICVAGRYARCGGAGGEAGAGAECAAGARAVLGRGAQDARRSLLNLVTMQADTGAPTAQHRLLCRLALCIVSPSDKATRAYEAACAAVLGSSPDVLAWGRAPKPIHLPRLAVRLYPNAEKYFKEELDFAREDD